MDHTPAPPPTQPTPPPRARLRLTRRTFGHALLALGLGAILTADGPPLRPTRPLPIAVDDDTARYLHALHDLPTPDWSLLAVTAAVLDPGSNATRDLFGRLPSGNARNATLGWTYRTEAGRMADLLIQAERVYNEFLPPNRARHYGGLLATERARLIAGGQADYSAMGHLITLVNREQGLIARAELDDLHLIRRHRLDPANQPKDVPTLLHERQERRALALAFRREATRLLGTAAQRVIAAPPGTITLLGDLGAAPGDRAQTYQFARTALHDLDDATLAAAAVYFTAGEFLAHEPATPPDRWADRLPAAQRAEAPASALSPRLNRSALLNPAYASRILWLPLPDSRTLVAELRAL